MAFYIMPFHSITGQFTPLHLHCGFKYHSIPWHSISCHSISEQFTPRHSRCGFQYHIMAFHIMAFHTMPFCTISFCAMQFYTTASHTKALSAACRGMPAYQLPNTAAAASNVVIFQLTATLPFTLEVAFLGGSSDGQRTAREPVTACGECGFKDGTQPESISYRAKALQGRSYCCFVTQRRSSLSRLVVDISYHLTGLHGSGSLFSFSFFGWECFPR